MTYVGRVRVSYGTRLSRLERLQVIDAELAQMHDTLNQSEQLWDQSDKSQDERRLACTAVAVALTGLGVHLGVSSYAKSRLNDLLTALSELSSGRHSVLLAPSPVHPSTFSATDLQQQAIAQVCVDFLRVAGATADEARRKVAGLFEKHQLPKFSEAKLRHLNSRLKGPGSSQDEAYDTYIWAKAYADRTANELNLNLRENVSLAVKLADRLIGLAKRHDHRRDFFFASREGSR